MENHLQTHFFFVVVVVTGLSRLTSISMNDPVYIQVSYVSDESAPTSDPSFSPRTPPSLQADSYTVPDKLQQYMVVVPSKLRLVCLAAFILAKCQVTTDTHARRVIMQLSVDYVVFFIFKNQTWLFFNFSK